MAETKSEPNQKDKCVETPGMRHVFGDLVLLAADLLSSQEKRNPVMLIGPTGCGKRFILKRIREKLNWTDKTEFLLMNCAAMTGTMFDVEMYGYEPGAYTGASEQGSKGALGSNYKLIILDEVNSLKEHMQAKLLTVLDEGIYRRVGGTKNLTSKSQILAMCNANLEDRPFRDDFYRRFELIPIPPLHERRTDILVYLREWCPEIVWRRKDLLLLLCYDWPGNVRQLDRFTRAVIRHYHQRSENDKEYRIRLRGFKDPSVYPYGLSDLDTKPHITFKPIDIYDIVHPVDAVEIRFQRFEELSDVGSRLLREMNKKCPLFCTLKAKRLTLDHKLDFEDDWLDLKEIKDMRSLNDLDAIIEIEASNSNREQLLASWQFDWETWCRLYSQGSASPTDILTRILEGKIDDALYARYFFPGFPCVPRDFDQYIEEFEVRNKLMLLINIIKGIVYKAGDPLHQAADETAPVEVVTNGEDLEFNRALRLVCDKITPDEFKKRWLGRLVELGAKPAEVARKFVGLNRTTVGGWLRKQKNQDSPDSKESR